MTPREKAVEIVESAWRNASEKTECSISALLIQNITAALTIPYNHVRGPDGVDRPACMNCGAWWDRNGRCPLCMNTVNETAALAARTGGVEMNRMSDEMKMLDTLAELEKKATPGRWYFDGCNIIETEDAIEESFGEMICPDICELLHKKLKENGAFIVALRNAFPTLYGLAHRAVEADGELDVAQRRLEASENVVRELRRKLAEAGVEGSPPPTGKTTIGALLERAQNAEGRLRVAAISAEQIRVLVDEWFLTRGKPIDTLSLENRMRRIQEQLDFVPNPPVATMLKGKS